MAVTRSSAKITNMPISQEIREYFSELIRSLAANGVLADIFKKVQKRNHFEVWGKMWWIKQKNWWASGENDNEQYSRCSCLRIHGIECSDDERNDKFL